MCLLHTFWQGHSSNLSAFSRLQVCRVDSPSQLGMLAPSCSIAGCSLSHTCSGVGCTEAAPSACLIPSPACAYHTGPTCTVRHTYCQAVLSSFSAAGMCNRYCSSVAHCKVLGRLL